MDLPILRDVVVIFGLAIAVVLFGHRLRIPAIVGFLFTGVICGPHGLGLVRNVEEVELFSHVGIILLLFTVGVEFSLKKIFQYKRYFALGGGLQVLLTVVAGFGIAKFLGRPFGEAWFLGFLLSLSSTAIVFRLLEARSESTSSQGRLITGMLIFQDIVAVPMMLLVPVLTGEQADVQHYLWLLGLKGVGLVMMVIALAWTVVPRLLYFITKTRSRELFLLSVLVICFAVAWLSDWLGLSLSIGAFLAGLIISESEYSEQALGDILPLQDIFTSLFFVSVGMLLNIEFVVHEMALIVLTTAGVLLLKGVIITAVGISIGVPLRTVVLTAFALCQVGEFSFVLAKEGQAHGIGADYYYQLFLAVTLLGMGLTPFLLQLSHHAADLLLRLPISTKIKAGLYPLAHPKEVKHSDHVVIVGFGICGRNLAGSLKMLHIPYLVLEMNSDTVREERKNGEPITFGDATHEVVLRHAHLGTAKAIAIAINDPIASLRIIRAARKINPNIYMISRSRYVEESKSMFKQGADDVVPDEFGSSLEIFTRVLQQYHIPTEDIERVVTSIRNEGYEKLRELYSPASIMRQIGNSFRDIKMRTFVVESHSHVAGKSLAESALRQKHGITVLLIKRGEETLTNISADTLLQEGDRVVACGEQESLLQVMQLFHKGQAKG